MRKSAPVVVARRLASLTKWRQARLRSEFSLRISDPKLNPKYENLSPVSKRILAIIGSSHSKKVSFTELGEKTGLKQHALAVTLDTLKKLKFIGQVAEK